MDPIEVQKPRRNIFTCLSNDVRLSTLVMLNDSDAKLSKLARSLNMTIPSMKKHLKTMIEDGFIERNHENCLAITPLGQIILKQIAGFQFLSQNKKYFKTHSLSYIPTKFIHRIGALRNSELLTEVVTCMKRWEDVLDETTQFSKMIVAQVSLDIYKEAMPKLIKNDVKINYIFGNNTIVPKGWIEMSRKLESDLISKGRIERRMTDEVHVMMFLSENHGCIMFPDKYGVVDVDQMFVSRDEQFREWCSDLFDYVWKQSHPFVESKIQER